MLYNIEIGKILWTRVPTKYIQWEQKYINRITSSVKTLVQQKKHSIQYRDNLQNETYYIWQHFDIQNIWDPKHSTAVREPNVKWA